MLNTPYLPNWPTRLSENLKDWVTTIRSVVFDDWLELQRWVVIRLKEATDLLDADVLSLDSRIDVLEGTPIEPSKEDLTGLINGSNVNFSLSADHVQIILIVNGAVLHTPGDYTRSGVNITLSVAPSTGYVWCFYWS